MEDLCLKTLKFINKTKKSFNMKKEYVIGTEVLAKSGAPMGLTSEILGKIDSDIYLIRFNNFQNGHNGNSKENTLIYGNFPDESCKDCYYLFTKHFSVITEDYSESIKELKSLYKIFQIGDRVRYELPYEEIEGTVIGRSRLSLLVSFDSFNRGHSGRHKELIEGSYGEEGAKNCYFVFPTHLVLIEPSTIIYEIF